MNKFYNNGNFSKAHEINMANLITLDKIAALVRVKMV